MNTMANPGVNFHLSLVLDSSDQASLLKTYSANQLYRSDYMILMENLQ